jgi:hypothetical protein
VRLAVRRRPPRGVAHQPVSRAHRRREGPLVRSLEPPTRHRYVHDPTCHGFSTDAPTADAALAPSHSCCDLCRACLFNVPLERGRRFSPETDWSRGCIFPLLALLLLAVSCLALVEIGGRMQNPLGADFEDLPVHHIVDSTCKTSLAIIRVRPTRARRATPTCTRIAHDPYRFAGRAMEAARARWKWCLRSAAPCVVCARQAKAPGQFDEPVEMMRLMGMGGASASDTAR